MNLIKLAEMTEEDAREYLESLVWSDGVECPFCGSKHNYKLEGKTTRPGLYSCGKCRKPFTVTVNTIMHRSKLPIKTWLMAFFLVCSSKKGISALQVKRQLGLGSYRTAWMLVNKIRKAMEINPEFCKLFGYVEADETYVGGKGKGGKRGRGSEKKTPIAGVLERNGNVFCKPVKSVDADTLKSFVLQCVDSRSFLITDEWKSYNKVGKMMYGHEIVNHSHGEYVRGNISTNWIESFWSLLKKGIGGIFHHVSVKHLALYCNEFSFRWKHRNDSDFECFEDAIKGIVGKRITYKGLCLTA
jgi:transposase-like protein